jgi:hypothetical protein
VVAGAEAHLGTSCPPARQRVRPTTQRRVPRKTCRVVHGESVCRRCSESTSQRLPREASASSARSSTSTTQVLVASIVSAAPCTALVSFAPPCSVALIVLEASATTKCSTERVGVDEQRDDTRASRGAIVSDCTRMGVRSTRDRRGERGENAVGDAPVVVIVPRYISTLAPDLQREPSRRRSRSQRCHP